MKDYVIRLETFADHAEVENLVRESFWNVYRPGCTEHYVLHHLRNNADFIPELCFVMEQDGRIIGQNVFVRAKISLDDGTFFSILTMGQYALPVILREKVMERHCWIIHWKKPATWDLVPFALKVI